MLKLPQRSAVGLFPAILGILAVLVPAPAGAGEDVVYYTATFRNGTTTFPAKKLSVWIPQRVPLRGILWVLPGRGGDSRYSCAAAAWQEPARALGLGLIGLDNSDGIQYAGSNLDQLSGNFRAAMDGAAAATGRPEVANAPAAFYGFSWGGWNSHRFASAVPGQALCYINDKYSATTSLLVPSAAEVPGLLVSGENDRSYRGTTVKWFNTWRATYGADVALIADWGKGHSSTDRDLIWTHVAQAMKERYPRGQLPTATQGVVLRDVPDSAAWLGQSNRTDDNRLTRIGWPEIAPFDQYTGEASAASWLMNKTEALVYRAHNAAPPRVVDIAPAPGDDPYALETYRLGQTLDVSLNFALDPSLIEQVQLYHEDELLVDSGSFLAGGSAPVSFLPTQAGIHTFTAVVAYRVDGQTIMTSDYWSAAVVPEPGLLVWLAAGGLLALRRRPRRAGRGGRPRPVQTPPGGANCRRVQPAGSASDVERHRDGSRRGQLPALGSPSAIYLPHKRRRIVTAGATVAGLLVLLAATGAQGMAIHETWTGQDSEPWPDQWITGPQWYYTSIQQNQGEIRYAVDVYTLCQLDPAGVDSPAVENSVQEMDIFGTEQTSGMLAGLIARHNDDSPQYPYRACIINSHPHYGVLSITAGGLTLAATPDNCWTSNTWYRLKFSVQTTAPGSTQVAAKLWPLADPEPQAWTLCAIDSTAALQGRTGRVGIFGKTAVNCLRWWRFDNYSADGFVPEPTCLVLLGAAGAAMICRRHRRP